MREKDPLIWSFHSVLYMFIEKEENLRLTIYKIEIVFVHDVVPDGLLCGSFRRSYPKLKKIYH